jgi:FlaA1/EpsC-like NDP-sugar epimerase
MGASKRIAEKYVQSLQLKSRKENNIKATKFYSTVSEMSWVLMALVVPLFSKQIASGGPVTITHRILSGIL